MTLSYFARRDQDKKKMTESGGDCIHKTCENFSNYLKLPSELKPGQRQAVEALLKGSHVLAVL